MEFLKAAFSSIAPDRKTLFIMLMASIPVAVVMEISPTAHQVVMAITWVFLALHLLAFAIAGCLYYRCGSEGRRRIIRFMEQAKSKSRKGEHS